MLALIGLIPIYVLWGPNIIWKLFDMFIGVIQAFIFALLTVLYFAMAGAVTTTHDDEHEDARADEHDRRGRRRRGAEPPHPRADPRSAHQR